jgi:hypothetical protein
VLLDVLQDDMFEYLETLHLNAFAGGKSTEKMLAVEKQLREKKVEDMLARLEGCRIPRLSRPVKAAESLPGGAVTTEYPRQSSMGQNSMFETFFNFADHIGLRRVLQEASFGGGPGI